jgi:EmrB/QacA subfamily drug resistance transporter
MATPATTADARTDVHGNQQHGKWWPLAAVCLAVFMLLIDVTVVNVALPSIQAQLGASFSALQWVVDAYALTLSVFQLTSGTLGDRLGRKPVFITGIAIFTVFSLACGLAPTPETLDAFRALQGIGGAIMFANSLAIIGENYAGRDRGTAFGVWGATTGASIAIGPLIGGAVTSGIDWRWIFFINLPIGAVAILLAARRLGHSVAEQQRRVDWAGLALSGAGITTLVYALIEGNSAGWGSAEILVLFAATAVLLAAFIFAERRVAEPMLDVRLFRRPGFSGAQLAAFTISASLFSLFLYLTIYLQDILGYSAFGAGLRLLPITALTFLAAPLAGKLSARLPYRWLIGGGLALVAVASVLMTGLSASSSWAALLIGFVVGGFGSGLINPPLGSLAVSVVERDRAGMGAGVNNSFRQIGLATGIGMFGALFASRVSSVLTSRLPGLPPGRVSSAANAVAAGAVHQLVGHTPPHYRAALAHAARVAFVSGLNELFWVCAAIAAVGAVGSMLLIRQRDLVSGQVGH